MTAPAYTGRFERRTLRMARVEISRVDDSLFKEVAFTENVSPRGARVVTQRAWQPGTEVLVVFSEDALRLRAKAVYCQASGIARFAIGLELSAPASEWRSPTPSRCG
jgi:PilZ domain-containing protein